MKRLLPHETDKKFMVYAGTGTDLIFNHGLDLPGFASFPLLENPDTRAVLAGQMKALVDLASDMGVGCILDTPTWMANRDRAAPLGYNSEQLREINRDAVRLVEDIRKAVDRSDVLVSACIGPRYDPYADIPAMDVETAREYHRDQMASLEETSIDLVTGYTFNRLDEAAGCVLAASDFDLPIIMSLVVETDGCLADGTTLLQAVEQIEAKTDGVALFYMVNCAHPSHFHEAIQAHPRIRGIVANASSCSHAELDEAEELDEGDPIQLGHEVAAIIKANPEIQVFGGCCGTDMRHLRHMAVAVANP